MRAYRDIIEEFPSGFQLPMMKLMDQLRGEVIDSVKRSDFEELKLVVAELGVKISELAEAQKRTEARVEELAEAQKRTEARVEELAEAQKRTEARVEELAEAQKRTEMRLDSLIQRVEELAEAQVKTERILASVLKEQGRMRKEIGGLANSFGYMLENEGIRALPAILKREKGINITVMDRRFVVYPDGGYDEINIYGEGMLEGQKVYVVGEAKSQLGKKDVTRFSRLLSRFSNLVKSPVIPVVVTHSVHPDVAAYARDFIKDLEIYMSYQLKAA